MESRNSHQPIRASKDLDQPLPGSELDPTLWQINSAKARLNPGGIFWMNNMLRQAGLAYDVAAWSRIRPFDSYDFMPIACLAFGSEDRVVEVNAACAELLGVERSKLIYRSFTSWVDDADRDLWQRQLMLVRSTGESRNCGLHLKHANGTFLHVRMDCRLERKGGSSLMRIFFTDLTRQRQMEAEMLERRSTLPELHAMHVAVQTAASIAHELNQPLLAITSYSDAADMLMKNENPDMAMVRKAIEGCRREASRAGRSMRELMELFRMEVSPAEALDLNHEIEAILNEAKSSGNPGFEHVVLSEEGLPPVRANRTHLQKVLLNLLRNAVEAMTDAAVAQPVIAVKVQVMQEDKAVQVTVQDNGPGISREQLHRLFEPFFTTKSKGTGMGLAVSRSLIEENGGRLWADLQDADQLCLYPQERKGATFHFTLPLAS